MGLEETEDELNEEEEVGTERFGWSSTKELGPDRDEVEEKGKLDSDDDEGESKRDGPDIPDLS